MTIAFRYLPYLVQLKVMGQMALIEIFSLYTLSKKSQALAKSYFKRQQCEVKYTLDDFVRVHRNRIVEDYIAEKDQVGIRLKGDTFGLGVWNTKKPTVTIPASENKILDFVIELFPKLILSLNFGASDLILKVLNHVKSLNIPLQMVQGTVSSNEVFRAILKECSNAKRLCINSQCRSDLQYDFQPFNFDLFVLKGAEWVTKDHLINLFLGCKKVILSNVSETFYNERELLEIGRKWLEAPQMEFLEIQDVDVFSEGIERLPGAVLVERVTIIDDRGGSEELYFNGLLSLGKCYEMKKSDGTPAIIYSQERCIVFRTSFENAVVREAPVLEHRNHF